jgi:hypothetical protein
MMSFLEYKRLCSTFMHTKPREEAILPIYVACASDTVPHSPFLATALPSLPHQHLRRLQIINQQWTSDQPSLRMSKLSCMWYPQFTQHHSPVSPTWSMDPISSLLQAPHDLAKATSPHTGKISESLGLIRSQLDQSKWTTPSSASLQRPHCTA